MIAYVLAIDPGTKCGWAVLSPAGDRLASGTWNLATRRHEGGGMRYVHLRAHLSALLDAYPGAVLGYELVRRHLGVDAAHVYGGIVATAAALCEERGVPYQGIPVGTVKLHATGKGNASKDAMVAAALKRWGVEATEDEADALWIADAMRVEVGM